MLCRLFCMQCADSSDAALFAYMHGFYFTGSSEAGLRTLLRSVGGNVSNINNLPL